MANTPAPQQDATATPPKSPIGRVWIWAGLIMMMVGSLARNLFPGLSYTQWEASPWYVPAHVGFWLGWLLLVIGVVIRWFKVVRPWLGTLPEQERRRRYRRIAIRAAVIFVVLGTIPLLVFLAASSSH